MKKLTLLPLLLAQTLLAQYTELTNTEGVTIKAMVFDAGDPVKIKTEQGHYFSIPKEKFSSETINALSDLKIPQFTSVVDMSEDPNTGRVRNKNQRIIIKKDNTPIIGLYSSEKRIVEENFEKCIEHYESKVRGKDGIFTTIVEENKNRLPENPNADLKWNIMVRLPSEVFILPKCYSPVIFNTYYAKDINGVDPFSSKPKGNRIVVGGERGNGIYDTKADISHDDPPRNMTGPFASAPPRHYDPFGNPYKVEKSDPFKKAGSGLGRIEIDVKSFYYLYEYIKFTDFDRIVRDARDSR